MIRAKEYIHKDTEETPPAQDPVSIEIKRIEKADKLQPAAMQADSGSMQSFTSEEEDKSSVHLRPLDQKSLHTSISSEEEFTCSEASYKEIVLDTEEDRVELERANAVWANIYLE